jgi:hypothetical protein
MVNGLDLGIVDLRIALHRVLYYKEYDDAPKTLRLEGIARRHDGHSVARHVGTRTPQSHSALLGILAQSLEAAAVGVGEGGSAGES